MSLNVNNAKILKIGITLMSMLSQNQKKQIWLIGLLIFISSFFEVISIGSLLPFVSLIIDPASLATIGIIPDYVLGWMLYDKNLTVLALTALFSFSVFGASLLKFFVIKYTTKFAMGSGVTIATRVFGGIVTNVQFDGETSSSYSQVANLTRKLDYTISVYSYFINFFANVAIFVFVFTTLLVISLTTTVFLLGTLSVTYFCLAKITGKSLRKNSSTVSNKSMILVRLTQEAFKARRELKIGGLQRFFVNEFQTEEKNMRDRMTQNILLASTPRLIVETLIIVLSSVIACIAILKFEFTASLPILATFVFAAQRMLPRIQQAYQCWSSFNSNFQSIIDVNKAYFASVDPSSLLGHKSATFRFIDIEAKKLAFKYSNNTDYVFKNLSFMITRGDRVAIVGPSGSGKSTLADLICGLLNPTIGQIKVNGQSMKEELVQDFHTAISYLPQKTFLADDTIERNIALGFDQHTIDKRKIQKAAKTAGISQLLKSLPDKEKTIVGEDGAKISGGQRQRIGLARLCYNPKQFIIIDEGTNAIDAELEVKIIKNLFDELKSHTFVIISHSPKVADLCNKIIKIGGSS